MVCKRFCLVFPDSGFITFDLKYNQAQVVRITMESKFLIV